jgi:hypothetical protein
MHRTGTLLSSLVVVVGASLVVGGVGCSSSSSAAPTVTPVSFSSDVMPIFQASCTISSVCHGQMNNSGEENLYLGENGGNTATSTMNTYMGLVGVNALEDPKLALVKAGDSANSYLSLKLSGNLSSLAADCAAGMCNGPTCVDSPCGVQMPYLNAALPDAEQATINNWIDQGALNN